MLRAKVGDKLCRTVTFQSRIGHPWSKMSDTYYWEHLYLYFVVQGEEDQMCLDVNVDENPNQGARRRRKLLQTVTRDPVQKEAPKQKKVGKQWMCFAWNVALKEPLSTGVDLGRTFRNVRFGPVWKKCVFFLSIKGHSFARWAVRRHRGGEWTNSSDIWKKPSKWWPNDKYYFLLWSCVFIVTSLLCNSLTGCKNSSKMSNQKNDPPAIPQNLELDGESFLITVVCFD